MSFLNNSFKLSTQNEILSSLVPDCVVIGSQTDKLHGIKFDRLSKLCDDALKKHQEREQLVAAVAQSYAANNLRAAHAHDLLGLAETLNSGTNKVEYLRSELYPFLRSFVLSHDNSEGSRPASVSDRCIYDFFMERRRSVPSGIDSGRLTQQEEAWISDLKATMVPDYAFTADTGGTHHVAFNGGAVKKLCDDAMRAKCKFV